MFYFHNFFSKIVTFMRIMWKDIVGPGTPQMTPWHMRTAWWVAKAASIQDMEYLLLFHCNYGCTNAPEVTLYVHCLSLKLLQ
jgi:hypothetical protein